MTKLQVVFAKSRLFQLLTILKETKNSCQVRMQNKEKISVLFNKSKRRSFLL